MNAFCTEDAVTPAPLATALILLPASQHCLANSTSHDVVPCLVSAVGIPLRTNTLRTALAVTPASTLISLRVDPACRMATAASSVIRQRLGPPCSRRCSD